LADIATVGRKGVQMVAFHWTLQVWKYQWEAQAMMIRNELGRW